MNKKKLTYGFLFGSAVGAIAALLTTPKSGKALRQDVSLKKDEWLEQLQDIKLNANQLKESITNMSKEGKEIALQFVNDVKNAIEDWKLQTAPHQESLKNEIKELQETIKELEQKTKQVLQNEEQ